MSSYWRTVSFVLWIYAVSVLDFNTYVIGMMCPLSLELTQKVIQCPRNVHEWNVRAKIFNCSSINQTCVGTDMFQYHCVLNSNGTELLETCAPIKYIYGQKCAEFDAKGKIIQESSYNCSNAIVPCPLVYNSAEVFKYQSCYEEVPKKRKSIVTNDSVNCKIESSEISPGCIASLAINIIIMIIIMMYIFYQKILVGSQVWIKCKSQDSNSTSKSSKEKQGSFRSNSESRFVGSDKHELTAIL